MSRSSSIQVTAGGAGVGLVTSSAGTSSKKRDGTPGIVLPKIVRVRACER